MKKSKHLELSDSFQILQGHRIFFEHGQNFTDTVLIIGPHGQAISVRYEYLQICILTTWLCNIKCDEYGNTGCGVFEIVLISYIYIDTHKVVVLYRVSHIEKQSKLALTHTAGLDTIVSHIYLLVR
jgi:hypothetical protein